MVHKTTQLGFSLLEILVAFLITATTLTILFQIYSKGTHSTVAGGEYAIAVAIAESKLDELGYTLPLNTTRHSGKELNRYDWLIEIQDYEPPIPVSAGSMGLKSAEITITWEETSQLKRSITLNSIKPVFQL